MAARFYDPEIGRFLAQNSYLGEGNNPPNLQAKKKQKNAKTDGAAALNTEASDGTRESDRILVSGYYGTTAISGGVTKENWDNILADYSIVFAVSAATSAVGRGVMKSVGSEGKELTMIYQQ